MKPLAAILAAILLPLAAGCEDKPGLRTVQPVRSIDHIMLEAAPSAVNLDAQPGPDGFEVRVTLFRQDTRGSSVALDGVLELVMYDAKLESPSIPADPPARIWRFDTERLRQFAVPARANIGIAYGMSLFWADKPPAAPVVTLAARWQRPDGSFLYSAPVTVHVAK